jgi:hypothetical protein
MPSTYEYCKFLVKHDIVKTFPVDQNKNVFKINILIRTLRRDAYSLPSGERSINPVCLNFPMAYEYMKYVENRF